MNLLSSILRYQVEKIDASILALTDIGRQWAAIGNLKSEGEKQKYPLLTRTAKAICTLPHSNADSERIFSIVKKNKTEFRASMSLDTLNSLLVQKIDMLANHRVCHQATFSEEVLANAKKATKASLDKHTGVEDVD